MPSCSHCLPALVVPTSLPALSKVWWDRVGTLSTTPYFLARQDEAEPWDEVGLPYHSSLDSLAQSAKDCSLCRFILQKAESFMSEFRELEQNSQSRYFTIERGGHGLPEASSFKLVQRFEGADGFAVVTNSNRDRVLYLVAVVGFAVEPGEYSRFVRGQTIHPDAGFGGPLELAASWLQDCVKSHTCCLPPSGALPSRVIDLDALDDLNKVCLLETQNAEPGPYTALSHCWGASSSGHVTTTRKSLPDYIHGLFVDSLPQTFQDAIKVTRHLGIRYLWIDSLCICQDDTDDWAKESAAMADVYAGAHVVIAADSARNGSQGFFKRPERQYVPVELTVTSPATDVNKVTMVIPSLAFDVPKLSATNERTLLELEDEPLVSRAWALQERLLPYRILHFATDQLFFECNSHFVSEDGIVIPGRWNSLYPGPDPSFIQIARKSRFDSIHQLWYFILEDFTGRQLTVKTDPFPAISGLAIQLGRRLKANQTSSGGLDVGTEIEYVAGLWSDALVEGLGWQSLGFKGDKARLPDEVPLSGEPGYIAPTWSWASYEGRSAHGTTMEGWSDMAVATGWGVTLRNSQNPYGEVTDGWISLRAPLIRLSLSDLPEEDEESLPKDFRRNIRLCTPQGDGFGAYSRVDGVRGQTEETRAWAKEKALFALFLAKNQFVGINPEGEWSYTALIVQPVDSQSNTPSGKQQFRRLGSLHIGSLTLKEDEAIIEDSEMHSDLVLV
ncbi:hypothetical protein AK830_g187 [Neonectria ditissima]|uniref:Heterokaryon incompatibility domain-containing protein n=1 Tax=Neonectria ditissima TaxID=78410 RepID=A0A0P7BWM1_9HYPO|nr:hypothetical protein AK830_g187 [Neonectria ditissima]